MTRRSAPARTKGAARRERSPAFRPVQLARHGVDEKGTPRYAGKIGTGFDATELRRLAALMKPLARKSPMAKAPRAGRPSASAATATSSDSARARQSGSEKALTNWIAPESTKARAASVTAAMVAAGGGSPARRTAAKRRPRTAASSKLWAFARPGLDVKTREFATVAALTAMGTAAPQLKVHMQASLRVGASRQEIIETILQMIPYAGFPAAINAITVARQVFAE